MAETILLISRWAGVLANLGTPVLRKQGVPGSIPVKSTNFSIICGKPVSSSFSIEIFLER
jgi:hypothetical protein